MKCRCDVLPSKIKEKRWKHDSIQGAIKVAYTFSLAKVRVQVMYSTGMQSYVTIQVILYNNQEQQKIGRVLFMSSNLCKAPLAICTQAERSTLASTNNGPCVSIVPIQYLREQCVQQRASKQAANQHK